MSLLKNFVRPLLIATALGAAVIAAPASASATLNGAGHHATSDRGPVQQVKYEKKHFNKGFRHHNRRFGQFGNRRDGAAGFANGRYKNRWNRAYRYNRFGRGSENRRRTRDDNRRTRSDEWSGRRWFDQNHDRSGVSREYGQQPYRYGGGN